MALIVDIEKTLGDFHLNVHFTAITSRSAVKCTFR